MMNVKLGAWLSRYVALGGHPAGADGFEYVVKEGRFRAADADDELTIVLGMLAR